MPEPGYAETARRTQYIWTIKTLSQGVTEKNLLALAEGARQNTLTLIEEATKDIPTPLACETGCHFCCYLMATVSAPEALEIAHRLQTDLAPDELEEIKRRVKSAHRQTNKLDNVARIKSGTPCPFLTENGLCSIHPYRPLDCVTYHSLSQQACEALLEQPEHGHPTVLAIRHIGVGIKTGLGQGMVDANLEQPALRYELIEAIHIALNDPRAVEKYLGGTNIFMTAAIVIDEARRRTYKIKFAPKKLKIDAQNRIAQERQYGTSKPR